MKNLQYFFLSVLLFLAYPAFAGELNDEQLDILYEHGVSKVAKGVYRLTFSEGAKKMYDEKCSEAELFDMVLAKMSEYSGGKVLSACPIEVPARKRKSDDYVGKVFAYYIFVDEN